MTLKRHVWRFSQPEDGHLFGIYEECIHCGAKRRTGYWHSLKRADRYGVSRKWRKPGEIRGPRWCPFVEAKV